MVLHGGRLWRKYEEVPIVKENNCDTDDVEEITVINGGGGGGGGWMGIGEEGNNCLIRPLKARTTLLW